MSIQGDKDSFEPSQVLESQNIDSQTMENQKRRITWSNKIFQNTVNDKVEIAICERSKLIAFMKKVEECTDHITEKHIEELIKVTDEYELVTSELKCLFEQDKYGDFREEADWLKRDQTISEARSLIKKTKIVQSDRRSEAPSWRSRSHSHRTRRSSSSTSSHTRLNALAEAAAARESAEYERVIAAKEHDSRQRELDHKKEIAILVADKKVAIANAKLKAIEEALEEEELVKRINLPEVPEIKVEERTGDWVNSVASQETFGGNSPPNASETPHVSHSPTTNPGNPIPATTLVRSPRVPHSPTTKCLGPDPSTSASYNPPVPHGPSTSLTNTVPVISVSDSPLHMTNQVFIPQAYHDTATNLGSMVPPWGVGDSPHQVPNLQAPTQFSQVGDGTGSQLIESLTSANRQVVAGLARQNLPKCHPDIFSGDATLFHPWKRAFKAMMNDTSVTTEQEINYLRSFTCGEVQRVVDNFRKRHQNDPTALLQNLWKELETRFGSAAVITNALLERLHNASNFQEKDHAKLQEFSDLCVDVNSQIENLPGLACLHYPGAIRPIVSKLPSSIKTKWEKEVVKHAETHNDAYPDFSVFTRVVKTRAKIKNHPNILAGSLQKPTAERFRETPKDRRALRTSLDGDDDTRQDPPPPPPSVKKWYPYHKCDRHRLTECKAFGTKSLTERTEWIQKAGLCFRCLKKGHQAKKCNAKISCATCGNDRHLALLHKEKMDKETKDVRSTHPESEESKTEQVKSKCTAVCGDNNGGISCSKILLVDIVKPDEPNESCRVYAIIDDQSNSSLISSELADKLRADGPKEKYYLSTCSGNKETKFGRRVSGLVVRSVSNGKEAHLPTLVECDNFPDDKKEIPTPEIAQRFPHLQNIAREVPPLDESANVHVLLGRDAPELLKVRAFKNGPKGAPWAQKLLLGWTITGQVCLNFPNRPVHVEARKISVTSDGTDETEVSTSAEVDGMEYYVVPCPNQLEIIDSVTGSNIFCSTPFDNEVSFSIEDRKFLEIMEKKIHKNSAGHWEMPLPFRQADTVLPNNRSQAVHRLNGLLRTLKRKPQMEKDYLKFMESMVKKGHATPVPQEELKGQSGRVWYLPHFGVYQPKKPTKVRVVFDASAEFDGVSLNKVLLSGPDFMNSLLGVLIRFRRERVGVMCDIERMFYSFCVSPEHRDYLRFLWYEDNDPQKQVIEYRMNVHLFGNGPSPAVATFGLRKTVADEGKYGEEVKDFVHRNFYVDDGLASAPTAEEIVNLVTSTQEALATSNLRLHKVVSNSVGVMEAFSREDRATGVRDLDLRRDTLPAQRSLGVYWDLETDMFTFQVSLPNKPFTRRGVLSVINSEYDPLGMAAPVMLEGRKLLQQLITTSKGIDGKTPLAWDDPLPEKIMNRWQCWKDSLQDLEHVSVPRCYRPKDFGATSRAELHGFSDASQNAIGASVYLKLWNKKEEVSVSFVYGQARLAPSRPVSIPRLELCGAVLLVEAVQKILKEIDIEIAQVMYYTDSKVVLGYITNESKRFYVYVANRVQLIRSLSSPDHWRYIESERNPADLATRGVKPNKLMESSWLTGPEFLKTTDSIPPPNEIEIPSESDPEVRKEVIAKTTKVNTENDAPGLGSKRFQRFSSLSSLQRAIATLIVKVRKFKHRRNHPKQTEQEKNVLQYTSAEVLAQAMAVIVRTTQGETFEEDLRELQRTTASRDVRQRGEVKKSQRNTRLYRLDPFVASDGILRVGGRLRRAEFELGAKHPIILPRNDHVSKLVVRHYHGLVHHQGRSITRGAVRQAGYWIVGGYNMVSKEIHSCVTCKKLRGRPLEQQMADLPADRMEIGPPFTNVGFDVFGPWEVHARKTRGGAAKSKRRGLVFTCLTSRAIHIELLESMDASAFICALRRFFALRGQAAILRCDQGTNFVGGKSELKDAFEEMDLKKVQRFVADQGCKWEMNPPHASHFGGAWERQIGTIRRVLDGMFVELGKAQLTHELLSTLMAEVTGIVNARPLTAIPTDVDDPQPLSPAMLITMKTRPLGPPPGNFWPTDLYAQRRWKRVQYLADQFWLRWRREYLQSLQPRKKWNQPQRDLVEGDIVLMKEGEYRNDWPIGRVTNAIRSEDGKVRKARVVIVRDGQKRFMFRPIKELVLLVPADGVKENTKDGEKE